MMDYGVVPPEVNSGLMYSGVGSGPLAASAGAWQALATERGVTAASFMSGVMSLTASSWLGPSSVIMLAASLDYFRWLMQLTAQAEERAAATTANVNAFETAYAGVVHPAAIAANRSALMAAIGGLPWTAPEVAALEADYAEMWAQDSATLYAYAAEAATIASSIEASPFLPPDLSVNPAGLAAQGAASAADAGTTGSAQSAVSSTMGQLGQLPGSLSGVMSGVMSTPQQAISGLTQLLGSMTNPLSAMMSPSAGLNSSTGWSSPGFAAIAPAMRASMGGAGALSPASNYQLSNGLTGPRLSVPGNWATTAARQERATVSAASALSEEEGTAVTGAPRAGMMPAMTGNTGSAQSNVRYLPGAKIVQRKRWN